MVRTLKIWGWIVVAAAVACAVVAACGRPESFGDYYYRGLTKSRLGQYQDAVADLKVALELAQKAGNSAFTTELERLIQKFEQR